jgi:hypothetical protein
MRYLIAKFLKLLANKLFIRQFATIFYERRRAVSPLGHPRRAPPKMTE